MLLHNPYRMPRRSLSKELKEAISLLPQKEKDKLLFRLIPKDAVLTEQLIFRLLEDAATTESRRAEVARAITDEYEELETYRFSPGFLKMSMRSLSGQITRHVRVTRDKYGEVELNLQLLNDALEQFQERLSEFPERRTFKLYTYIIRRAGKINTLLDKMHEDYRLDFEDELRRLHRFIEELPDLQKMANRYSYQ